MPSLQDLVSPFHEMGTVAVSLEDNPGPKISAAAITGFLVSQLGETQFIRKAPFIPNS